MLKAKDQDIEIKGARVHNLKNIDLRIPRDTFTVITGLSGSGKSSLAFDTLYAEGQRRYVESLSSYARQFLGRIDKPDVDFIKGIPPAIAIEQKVNTTNPRSTVGTSTEIYDYLRLLYARIGRTYSPKSGKEVKRHAVSDVIDVLLEHPEGSKVMVLTMIHLPEGRSCKEQLDILSQQGFSRGRFKIGDATEIYRLSDMLKDDSLIEKVEEAAILIDRFRVSNDEDSLSRMADSIQTAFYEGKGECEVLIETEEGQKALHFSNRFEADGIAFDEPTIHMFNFNNPVGACPKCEGYGMVIGIDEDLVIPNKGLSVYEDAVACWRGEKVGEWKRKLIAVASKFDFPIHRPYYKLTKKQQQLLWNGNKHFGGINDFFAMLERDKHKIQYRVMLSRYRGKTTCPECNGTRLKKEASYVKVGGKPIKELVDLPVDQVAIFFASLELTEHEQKVSKRILLEINSRLTFLNEVGLGYLTLNRLSSTLSGGESQRINLATSLGSSLVGSLYILDEPSIGLHSRDTERLINVLRNLKQLGNTVLVVEHDEDIMKAADQIIDIGPEAGTHGGEVVFQGPHSELLKADSLTAEYLTHRREIPVPKKRRKWKQSLEIVGAHENNLKNIDVKFPLGILTAISGVSGSGKSSLVRKILYSVLNKQINGTGEQTGHYDTLQGDLDKIENIEFVDQNPIGKSSRSNPVTYIKAYDEIRKLFSEQQAAKVHGFKPAHFSFNVEGGRCEECQGEGEIKIEMQFMADVHLVCETCKGKRFKDDVLEVTYRQKNIFDILELTVDEAVEFFAEGDSNTEKKIVTKLKTLQSVGLGYVKLGQSSSTLSGGESQRIKLASFLGKEKAGQSTVFIFDEPTTGLHFHDINKLLAAFEALIERGNTIIVIEHNLDVIKCADWVIDLGPDGGDKGGNLVFEGTPEDMVKCKESHTGYYLAEKLK